MKMRIYNRNSRSNVRYYLRLLRADMAPMDYWTLAMALTLLFFVILWPAAASAQDDPCEACIADWSVAECPCLPETPEPEPPISATVCEYDAGLPSWYGCEGKVFMPYLATTPITKGE